MGYRPWGSQRVGHDWAANTSTSTLNYTPFRKVLTSPEACTPQLKTADLSLLPHPNPTRGGRTGAPQTDVWFLPDPSVSPRDTSRRLPGHGAAWVIALYHFSTSGPLPAGPEEARWAHPAWLIAAERGKHAGRLTRPGPPLGWQTLPFQWGWLLPEHLRGPTWRRSFPSSVPSALWKV